MVYVKVTDLPLRTLCVTNVGQLLSRLQLQSGATSSNDEDMP